MYSLSVLVSGSGSTLDNLATHCFNHLEGMLFGFVTIKQVVADRQCKAATVAEKWKLPFKVIKKSDYQDLEEWSEALFDNDAHLHVMGGFLSKVVVPEALKNRVVNIHPSLLPAYGGEGMYGIKVHEAVVANQETITGCTVHVVDNEYDHGPIIGQMKVGVLKTDTPASLQHAVQEMEKLLYPRTLLNYLRTAKP